MTTMLERAARAAMTVCVGFNEEGDDVYVGYNTAEELARAVFMTICASGRREPVGFAVEPTAWGDDDEIEANASLIAAAPDLLEACLWLKEYAEVQVRRHPSAPDSPKWQSLLDAIARARGES